jgi:hypothetical protein
VSLYKPGIVIPRQYKKCTQNNILSVLIAMNLKYLSNYYCNEGKKLLKRLLLKVNYIALRDIYQVKSEENLKKKKKVPVS